MPAGLQAWDANGQVTLDTTQRVGRFKNKVEIATTGSGSVTYTKAAGEIYFAFMTLTDPAGRGTITITSTGFNWTFTSPGTATIFYGIV